MKIISSASFKYEKKTGKKILIFLQIKISNIDLLVQVLICAIILSSIANVMIGVRISGPKLRKSKPNKVIIIAICKSLTICSNQLFP